MLCILLAAGLELKFCSEGGRVGGEKTRVSTLFGVIAAQRGNWCPAAA